MKNLLTRLLLMSLMIIGLVTTSYSADFYTVDAPTEQSALMAEDVTSELNVHFETINRFTMAEYPYGIQLVEVGDFNPTTGLGENYEDIGEILRDTLNISTTRGNITRINSELKTKPIAKIKDPSELVLSFSLLDCSADNMVKYMGGTVTGVAPAPKTYNPPAGVVNIELAFRLTFKSGNKLEIRRGDVDAVYEWSGRAAAFVMNVTVEPLETEVQDVLPFAMTDHTAQA